MNKKNFISSLALIIIITTSLIAEPFTKDITNEIPVIITENLEGYKKVKDVAQYGNADWNNVIGIAKNIAIEKAKEIADNDPEITFFFYTKGYQMVLGAGKEDGSYRVFRHGDAVFFSGNPWWGSAPRLADGYVKLK